MPKLTASRSGSSGAGPETGSPSSATMAEDYNIKAPLHDPVSLIYDLCYEGVYREISALVRPVLAAELGVVFTVEPKVLRNEDGSERPFEYWRFERDAAAMFSVLDG